jgi:CubicO group peptidase (beta-lactamase class C family)
MRRALCLAVLLIAQSAHAQAQVDPSQLEHRLHALGPRGARSDSTYDLLDRMRLYHVPGVSIAIVDGDHIVFARGYGVTEFGGSKPVDSTTIFLAGSISKPIFATGVLALVQQGKLSLDDDVNRRLTSWHLPESRFTATEKVTLRRLLTHSAGLTVHGFPGYAVGEPIPTVPQLLDGQPPANTPAVRNDATPGARYNYSGGGITIAQLLTTDVTHESFPALMQRLVLRPAGMVHSTYENPLPKERWAEASTGHEKTDTPIPGHWHVYPEMAAAGLWTTPADLARWAIALSDAYNGKSQRLLSTSTARQMVSHQVDVEPSCREGWGLGVAFDGDGGDVHFSHGGRDEGFVASLDMWPALGQGIVVLTNGVSGQLLDEIQAAFHQMYAIDKAPKKHTPVALDPRVLDAYVGRYQVAPKATLLVTREGNALFIRPTGQPRFEIAPESDRRFFPTTFEAQVTFETDASGRATALIVDENGCSPRATRLDDATAKQITDAEDAFAKRFKDQTAAPGSEAALRRMIEEVRLGNPNYDLMSPGWAEATRQQLPQLQKAIVGLGALQSLSFKGVGPGGADIYTVKFESGTLEYRIWLSPDGKIDNANYRPPPAP